MTENTDAIFEKWGLTQLKAQQAKMKAEIDIKSQLIGAAKYFNFGWAQVGCDVTYLHFGGVYKGDEPARIVGHTTHIEVAIAGNAIAHEIKDRHTNLIMIPMVILRSGRTGELTHWGLGHFLKSFEPVEAAGDHHDEDDDSVCQNCGELWMSHTGAEVDCL